MIDKLTIDVKASELDTLRYKILMQQEESHKDYANKTLALLYCQRPYGWKV